MMSEDRPATPVRHFAPTNRLTALIREPGGKAIKAALEEAQAAIEQYRPEVIGDIDARILELERLAADPTPSIVAREEVYRAASAILEHAGLFGLRPVGEAAYSLCELVDRLANRAAWDAPAVSVHVGSIRLLRELGEDQELQRAQLLRGLHAVVAKVVADLEASKSAA